MVSLLFDTRTAPTTTSGIIATAVIANGNSGFAADAAHDLAMTMESPRVMKMVESTNTRANTIVTVTVGFNELSTLSYAKYLPVYNQHDE